ncbi:hypothetical protein CFP56_036641 [Quercus suber]|uniref:Uncharacterized protein n=1 Tax=Quercus suber TaxID=58331 RepID=A0AAW0J6Q8_QUESU
MNSKFKTRKFEQEIETQPSRRINHGSLIPFLLQAIKKLKPHNKYNRSHLENSNHSYYLLNATESFKGSSHR